MKINRLSLLSHIERLNVDGILPDFVLNNQWEGFGASADRSVMVISGPLEKVDPLAGELGIPSLKMVKEVLKSAEEDDISIVIEDRYMVVASQSRLFKLVMAAPKVIGTRVDASFKDKVLKLIPSDVTWYNLEMAFVEGVLKAYSILKPEFCTLHVGKSGGYIGVGDPKMNEAKFDFPALMADEEYDLILPTVSFIPILNQVKDFTKAQLALTGPLSIIVIREGAYTYIASPDKPAEEKK